MKQIKLLVIGIMVGSIILVGCNNGQDTATFEPEDNVPLIPIEEPIKNEEGNISLAEIKDGLRLNFDFPWNISVIYNMCYYQGKVYFLYQYIDEKEDAINQLYCLDQEKKSYEKVIEFYGNVWNSIYEPESGKLIYSCDFDDLYYIDSNKRPTLIMDEVLWYRPSPDNQFIVLSNMTNRYIYNVKDDTLIQTDLIPDIDYVFSPLVATWNNDSTHLSSLTLGETRKLNIIDGKENKVIKSIQKKGTEILHPQWSSDGRYLAFLVQSNDYKDYVLQYVETYLPMSDKIGIYDMKEDKLQYIDIEDGLIIQGIKWDSIKDSFFIETASIEDCDLIMNNDISSKEIEAFVYHINAEDGKMKKVLDYSREISNLEVYRSVQPLSIIDDDFIYCVYHQKDEILKIRKLNEEDETVEKNIVLGHNIGYINDYTEYESALYLTTSKGLYQIDASKNLELILDGTEYNSAPLVMNNWEQILFSHDSKEHRYIDIITINEMKKESNE